MTDKDLEHRYELLVNGINELAQAFGIINPGVTTDGPMLLMLLEDMQNELSRMGWKGPDSGEDADDLYVNQLGGEV